MVLPRRKRPPTPATAQTFHLPAPTGGLNTVAAGLAMPPTDCVSAVNLMSAENGLRSRLGYTEWVTGLTGNATSEVRTLIPFTGTSNNDALYCATETGLWNITASTTTPTRSVTFGATTGRAGWGVSAGMVTAAGHFNLYTDEENGLYVYSESGASWSKVAQGTGASEIDGVNPARFVFVTVFKGRAWFVEESTANAWYLPVGQIYGTATKFSFGSVFARGGTLVGLWRWTYDGGAGLDDSLVAVSSAGDVVIYQGTDPSSASAFGLKGTWSIDAPPAGRRIATSIGGDLLLLSRQGLVPLSRLVVGATSSEEYATAKVANLLNKYMLEKANTWAWAVQQQPADNSLLLLIPKGSSSDFVQLAQAVASKGWFLYEGLPMHSATSWSGTVYFGTDDGRVCRHTGYVDNVPIADPDAWTAVDWRLLTAFSSLGTPRQKQVQMIRPLLLSEDATVSVEAAARYDYDQGDLDAVAQASGTSGTWDNATWDTDVWAGGAYAVSELRGGSVGLGSSVAIALRGTAACRTVLVGMDVAFTQGGFL